MCTSNTYVICDVFLITMRLKLYTTYESGQIKMSLRCLLYTKHIKQAKVYKRRLSNLPYKVTAHLRSGMISQQNSLCPITLHYDAGRRKITVGKRSNREEDMVCICLSLLPMLGLR